jgi:peptidoglycan/LPS O-acetylase OafA/YrhL
MTPPGPTSAPTGVRPDSHRFLMLDLMRGIAALGVLIYHDSIFLGVQLLPDAYLAVDLFFLLSGFVIAHNYDAKIASGMSLGDFTVQRLIRLYPCFILTFALGFLLTSARLIRDAGYVDVWRLMSSGALNAVFLPATTPPYQIENLFPYNGAAWSLTFELFANIFYWLTFRSLDKRRLILLVTVSAVTLAISAYLFGFIDVGMRPTDFWWGVPRVMLTFFMGVALRRHVYGKLSFHWKRPGVTLVILLIVMAFSISNLCSKAAVPILELLIVAVGFPLLLIAVGSATPGPRAGRLCTLVGNASYPVYLLQNPLIGLFAAIPQLLFAVKASAWIPWIGIAHVVTTVLCALWIDRHFELPLRKMLKDYWRSVSRPKLVAVAAAERDSPP